MKLSHFICISLILTGCLLTTCSSGKAPERTLSSIESKDSCSLHPENAYRVFVPEHSDREKLPLLVVLDAHGEGKTALQHFRQAARDASVVLVASELIRNNYPDFQLAIQQLVEDVRQKYPVDNTLFLSGFSGGARMALAYALTKQVNGLMLCGALGTPNQLAALKCPVLSVSGMDDFNFIETAQYLFQEDSKPKNLYIELTNQSHAWPDSVLLSDKLIFLKQASSANKLSGDNSTASNSSAENSSASMPLAGNTSDNALKAYCSGQKQRIDGLQSQGAFIQADVVAASMAAIPAFNKTIDFSKIRQGIQSTQAYRNQFTHLGEVLQNELNAREPLLQAFQTKDATWWKQKTAELLQQIQTQKDPLAKNQLQRIKGFLGIACYSLGNQAVQQHDEKTLKTVLLVYKLLEPETSYQWYLSAFLPYWKGNTTETKAFIQKALEHGFNEFDKLKENLPQEYWTRKLR